MNNYEVNTDYRGQRGSTGLPLVLTNFAMIVKSFSISQCMFASGPML